MGNLGSSKLEMPVEVVGEHVKSGQKILADIDSATGAIQMRDKWKHLSDVVLAKVEELNAWKTKHDPTINKKAPKTPEEEIAQADKQIAALDAEEKKIKKKAKEAVAADLGGKDGPLANIDTSKIDPALLAIIQMQQVTMNQLIANQAAGKEEAESQKLNRTASMVDEGKREIRMHQARLADDLKFSRDHEDIPPPPKKNPQFGDKTPAYVNWLRQHRPDVYEDRYGVQEFDKTIHLKDGEGNLIKVTKDIGLRQTHKTQKLQDDPTLASDMDWNA